MPPRDSLRHRIFWHEQLRGPGPRLPPLARDLRTDVVVVGGGVAGLSCARAVRARGHRVVLLEAAECGAGASGRSSGFVTPDGELELADLLRSRGQDEAKRLWTFALDGVDAIRGNIERYGIACELVIQDSLFLASSRKGEKVVRAEHAARTGLGYPSALHDASSLPSILGMSEPIAGVRYPGSFGMNAYLYCQRLRDALLDEGVVIHEDSPVVEIGDGELVANGSRVQADAVVLCLDRYLRDLGVLSKEVYHAQTFLAVSKPLDDRQVGLLFPESPLMVWDTDLIYQYFRLAGKNRLLLGAATLLDTYSRKERDDASRILPKMRAWLASRFPWVPIELEYFWPGLLGVSKDFLPVVARDAARPRVQAIGGAAGLAWADALGRYVASRILSERSDFDAAFGPDRKLPVGRFTQRLLGTPGAFALSHAIVKVLR